MKIRRVLFHDLRALEARDDLLIPEWPVPADVCLRGLNGSGKTTWLLAVTELWRWLHHAPVRGARPHRKSLLLEAGLAAMEVTDAPGPMARFWLAWGSAEGLRRLPSEAEGLIPGAEREDLRRWWLDAAQQRTYSRVGVSELPNMVILEATDRSSREFQGDIRTPTPAWWPVARYNHTNKPGDHLDTLILRIYTSEPEGQKQRWRKLTETIAKLRPRLTLSDVFEPTTQRPVFLLDGRTRLSSDCLSAGEQAMLITLVLVLCWLDRGGVVLVDEPELHQHLALMRTSLLELSEIVRGLGGQLIVASHAPEVWDHHQVRGVFVDLDASSTS